MGLRALIEDLRHCLDEEVGLGFIQAMFHELMQQFFGDLRLPMPHIKIVDHTIQRYLGRCSWVHGKPTTTIEVQRGILDDEDTLRRVLAHELIHHVQFMELAKDPACLSKIRLGTAGGHGSDFLGYAKQMNAVLGQDYVTTKSDQSYSTTQTKDFYLIVQPHREGPSMGFTIAVRPSTAQKQEIQRRMEKYGARVFKTNDQRFAGGLVISKRAGGYSLTRDPEAGEKLKELYHSGQQVSL